MGGSKSDNLARQLVGPGAEHPDVRWILAAQAALVVGIAALLPAVGYSHLLIAYAVGALLISFNFTVLARLIPQLIFLQSGAVFSLLFSFYLRLFFTGAVLFFAIYFVELSAIGLLLGLSTILASFVAWGGRFFVSYKQKEA
ncbi:MAG: hypothetical protein K9K39_07615 [Desulfohalobiaceae bacterium]|nr:hypothetical protein [Desulfohalobiaceae bacterium]